MMPLADFITSESDFMIVIKFEKNMSLSKDLKKKNKTKRKRKENGNGDTERRSLIKEQEAQCFFFSFFLLLFCLFFFLFYYPHDCAHPSFIFNFENFDLSVAPSNPLRELSP